MKAAQEKVQTRSGNGCSPPRTCIKAAQERVTVRPGKGRSKAAQEKVQTRPGNVKAAEKSKTAFHTNPRADRASCRVAVTGRPARFGKRQRLTWLIYSEGLANRSRGRTGFLPNVNWPVYLSHGCSVVATACIKSRPDITALGKQRWATYSLPARATSNRKFRTS